MRTNTVYSDAVTWENERLFAIICYILWTMCKAVCIWTACTDCATSPNVCCSCADKHPRSRADRGEKRAFERIPLVFPWTPVHVEWLHLQAVLLKLKFVCQTCLKTIGTSDGLKTRREACKTDIQTIVQWPKGVTPHFPVQKNRNIEPRAPDFQNSEPQTPAKSSAQALWNTLQTHFLSPDFPHTAVCWVMSLRGDMDIWRVNWLKLAARGRVRGAVEVGDTAGGTGLGWVCWRGSEVWSDICSSSFCSCVRSLENKLWISCNFSFSSFRKTSTRRVFSFFSCSLMFLGTSGITQATSMLMVITRFCRSWRRISTYIHTCFNGCGAEINTHQWLWWKHVSFHSIDRGSFTHQIAFQVWALCQWHI